MAPSAIQGGKDLAGAGAGRREAFLGEVGWWLNVEVFEDGCWGRGLYFRLGKHPGEIVGSRKAPVCTEAWK